MGSGINWGAVLTGLGQAVQGGIQGYQTPPGQLSGQSLQNKQPGTGVVGQTPSTPGTPQGVNMQAPQTGGIVFPTSAPPGSTPPGGWNTPTGHLPQIPLAPMSFKSGGIVPHTGLYEVRGGEVIVPKKKVAKLHKGEKVLLPTRRPAVLEGQFVGGFQDGGEIPMAPTPMSEQVPGQPTTQDKIKAWLANLQKMQGTVQQQQAGLGMPRGGMVSPARVGAVPQVQQQQPVNMLPGGMSLPGMPQLPGAPQTPGVGPGLPPAAPGQPGGPSTYAQGVQQPPYQSQFIDKAERKQYITQNLLAGVSNAILMHKQKEYDKTVNESQQEAMRQITLKQEAQDGQGQQQPQVNARPGQPAQPGQPPIPQMTRDEMATYNQLKKDPATQKQAEQFAKLIDRRNTKAMKNLEKAQTDPNSPQYRGYMMAQQQMQAQQMQQVETQAKIAQAQAQIMDAQNKAKQIELDNQAQQQFQDMFNPAPTGERGVGQPPPTPTSPGAAGTAGDPPDMISRLKPSPMKTMIDSLQKDQPFNANERAEVNSGILRSLYNRNFDALGQSVSKVAQNREKGDQDVGTWYNPKTKEVEETTRNGSLQLSAQLGVPNNFLKMNQTQRAAFATRQTQLNDVQMNVSRFTYAASQYQTSPPSRTMQVTDQVNLHTLMDQAGVFDLKVKIGEGGGIEIPGVSAALESLSRQTRTSAYQALSPQGKDLFDGYLRTMASMPAYYRAITPGARFTEQQLNLELGQLANPTWSPADILRRQNQFDENIARAQTGVPHLIGSQRVADIRQQYEHPLDRSVSGGGDGQGGDMPQPVISPATDQRGGAASAGGGAWSNPAGTGVQGPRISAPGKPDLMLSPDRKSWIPVPQGQ